MPRSQILLISTALTLAACQPQPTTDVNATAINADDGIATMNQVPPVANSAETAPPAPVSPSPPSNDQGQAGPAPGTPGGLPDDRTPISEPKGPIDSKSTEAAGQVVQMYGALLEERKFTAARKLWGGGGEASALTEAQFIAAYAKYAVIHSEVGKPGDSEGAAGSIYVDVPFHLFGKLKSGGPFNLIGSLSLRRVNDVDGSTAEQRRWHIFQSGLKPRP